MTCRTIWRLQGMIAWENIDVRLERIYNNDRGKNQKNIDHWRFLTTFDQLK